MQNRPAVGVAAIVCYSGIEHRQLSNGTGKKQMKGNFNDI